MLATGIAWVHKGKVADRYEDRARTRRRIEELRQRTLELEERNRELVDQELAHGSTAADVERAQERASQARERAAEAQQRASGAYLRSAAAHEAAARRQDELAMGGIGDAEDHRRRAAEHRAMSRADLGVAADAGTGHAPGSREPESRARGNV